MFLYLFTGILIDENKGKYFSCFSIDVGQGEDNSRDRTHKLSGLFKNSCLEFSLKEHQEEDVGKNTYLGNVRFLRHNKDLAKNFIFLWTC